MWSVKVTRKEKNETGSELVLSVKNQEQWKWNRIWIGFVFKSAKNHENELGF